MNFIKIIKKCCVPIILIGATFTMGCDSQYIGKDRNSKWIKDIDYLAKTLPEKHKNVFFKISKNELDNEINELKKEVPSMNDDEVTVGIQKIIASMGDAHTDCYPRGITKAYPLNLYWFNDGIYVRSTLDKYKNIQYCKLVKVNGKDIKEIDDSIEQIIPHENISHVKCLLPQYLINPEVLHGLKITSNRDKATFTFEDKKKHSIDVQVDTIIIDKDFKNLVLGSSKDNACPLYMQNADKAYWYKYLDSEKILYFKYNSCMNDTKNPFTAISREMLNFMDSHTVNKLVIDLRNNDGGDSSILEPFIDKIKEKSINKNAKLFVIVGRQTFSSALLNAIYLKNNTNATFVGEETGGKPNHFGELGFFELPNSRISISYSTKEFKYSKMDSPSFTPDKTIELSIDDFIQKKDPVMDYIVNQ